MNKFKNFMRKLWSDESGQGTAEYVLLIAIVVGLLVLVGPRVKEAVEEKLAETTGKFGEIQ